MPYIDYDKNGQITGQFANQQYDEQIYTDLVIDDVDKFKVIQNVVIDISDTKEYKAKELADAKQAKTQEIYDANTAKYSEKNQTITINLPVTLTDGKTETPVESFKLLTLTSAGTLLTVITGLIILAQATTIPDTLATSDGLIIKGLNELVGETKLINLIFAKLGEVIAKITVYQRTLETQINACETVDDVNAIAINFGQF